MDEKLLAQRILKLVRESVGKKSREAEVALEWARDHREWLWPDRVWADTPDAVGATIDWESLLQLADEIGPAGAELPMFTCIGVAAELLDLGEFDRSLVETAAALQRLPRLTGLRMRLAGAGADLIGLAGRLAGATSADAEVRVRRSEALALGLLYIERELAGGGDLQLQWNFAQLLDDACLDSDKIVEALAGVRQAASRPAPILPSTSVNSICSRGF